MSFNIHQIDNLDFDDAEAEEALEDYQDALLEEFASSPEGQQRLASAPEIGFWVAQLIYYGYTYVDVTLPQMSVRDVKEIVTELFPRKISLLSPDDLDDAIPELRDFWQYLKREYKLSQTDAILNFLSQIEPEFKNIMYDSDKFGMAKSFMTMGQAAGFDMTSESGLNAFMQHYNANLSTQSTGLPSKLPEADLLDYASVVQNPFNSKMPKAKKKKLRDLSKASRKRNRKGRK